MFSPSSHSSHRVRLLTKTSGFGLIELMVSISIMVLILGVVLIRQDGFNSAVLLRNEAYKIALQVREVQLSAVSAARRDTGNAEDFRTPIGLYFDTDTPNRYIIFQDTGSTALEYDSGDSEIMQAGVIDPRFELQLIDGSPNASVSILFERPDYDAIISSGASQVELTLGEAASTGNETRRIEITSTGQVAVLE